MPFKAFKPKIEKSKGNVSLYRSHKVILELKKAGQSVLFCTKDLPDEWLIDMIRYKNKTGEISYDCMINASDFDYWVNFYEDKGFVKV
jgi:hypothetical protein